MLLKKRNLLPGILLILSGCNGCFRDQGRIDALIRKIDSLDERISAKQTEISDKKKQLINLEEQKQNIYAHAAALKDSADNVIKQNLVEAAYISEFDQSPYQFLKEYVDALSTKDRIIMFTVQYGLKYYADRHIAEVALVRKQLRYFDDQKETCISQLSRNANEARRLQADITASQENLSDVKSRKKDVSTELESLK
jgi:chromosome segregation ATPase